MSPSNPLDQDVFVRTKNFLTCARPAPYSTPARPAPAPTHSSAGSRTRLTQNSNGHICKGETLYSIYCKRRYLAIATLEK